MVELFFFFSTEKILHKTECKKISLHNSNGQLCLHFAGWLSAAIFLLSLWSIFWGIPAPNSSLANLSISSSFDITKWIHFKRIYLHLLWFFQDSSSPGEIHVLVSGSDKSDPVLPQIFFFCKLRLGNAVTTFIKSSCNSDALDVNWALPTILCNRNTKKINELVKVSVVDTAVRLICVFFPELIQILWVWLITRCAFRPRKYGQCYKHCRCILKCAQYPQFVRWWRWAIMICQLAKSQSAAKFVPRPPGFGFCCCCELS